MIRSVLFSALILSSCAAPPTDGSVALWMEEAVGVPVVILTHEDTVFASDARTPTVATRKGMVRIVVDSEIVDSAGRDSVAWLLLPANVHVREGAFRGAAVQTDLLLAGQLNRWIRAGFPSFDQFPIALAVDAPCGSAIALAVSGAVRQLDTLGGRGLFVTDCGRFHTDVRFRVEVREGPLGDALGKTSPASGCQPWRAHCTFYSPSQIEVTIGTVRSDVVAHELLHVLGLGHSCLVNTLLSTTFSEGELARCSRERQRMGIPGALVLQREATASDAASIQLLRDIAAFGADFRGWEIRLLVVSSRTLSG